MGLIGLEDKAVDAIRGRAREVAESEGFFGAESGDRAAEVLAALDRRTDYGSVDFKDRDLAWLKEDAEEMRQEVEGNTCLVDGLAVDWQGSTGDAHYVWAIEDILDRVAQAQHFKATGEMPGSVDSLEPEPVDGWKTIEGVAGISAEIERLEAWWDVIDEPPTGHPDWALSDEVDSWVDDWKSMYRKVLELIAEGKVDPTEAARAAIADPRKAVA